MQTGPTQSIGKRDRKVSPVRGLCHAVPSEVKMWKFVILSFKAYPAAYFWRTS